MENTLKFNFDGNNSLLQDNSFKLGIVGSRSIIEYTKKNLESLFEELKNYDFTIVSGGMYGVDIYAHNLAIQKGLKTIFVLPCGINTFKKSSLYKLVNSKYSLDKVLFLSEYPENFSARKYTFIERNKIISSISEVLIVAQASIRSGSISTANFAMKNNKTVIAIPFSLDIGQFQGTNLLIDRGASIYLDPFTILKKLNISSERPDLSIIKMLSKEPLTFDNLVKNLDYDPILLQKNLLKLILEGRIIFNGEKYYI